MKFYKDALDRINFDDNWTDEVTILEKLKSMIKSNLRNEEDIAVMDVLDVFFDSRKKVQADLVHETHCNVETIGTDSSEIKVTEVPCI